MEINNQFFLLEKVYFEFTAEPEYACCKLRTGETLCAYGIANIFLRDKHDANLMRLSDTGKAYWVNYEKFYELLPRSFLLRLSSVPAVDRFAHGKSYLVLRRDVALTFSAVVKYVDRGGKVVTRLVALPESVIDFLRSADDLASSVTRIYEVTITAV